MIYHSRVRFYILINLALVKKKKKKKNFTQPILRLECREALARFSASGRSGKHMKKSGVKTIAQEKRRARLASRVQHVTPRSAGGPRAGNGAGQTPPPGRPRPAEPAGSPVRGAAGLDGHRAKPRAPGRSFTPQDAPLALPGVTHF